MRLADVQPAAARLAAEPPVAWTAITATAAASGVGPAAVLAFGGEGAVVVSGAVFAGERAWRRAASAGPRSASSPGWLAASACAAARGTVGTAAAVGPSAAGVEAACV